MTKVQADRLRKLARFLRKVPSKKFDMHWYVRNREKLNKGNKMSFRRNTSACMAGWATAIFPEIRFDKDGFLWIENNLANEETLANFFGVESVFYDDYVQTPKQAAKALLKIVADARPHKPWPLRENSLGKTHEKT